MEQFVRTIQRLLSVDNFSANHEERGLFTRYAFTYIINIRVIYGCQLLTPDTVRFVRLKIPRDIRATTVQLVSQSYFHILLFISITTTICYIANYYAKWNHFWIRLFSVFTKKSIFHHKIYLSWYDSLSSLSTLSHAICMYRVRDISFQPHVG